MIIKSQASLFVLYSIIYTCLNVFIYNISLLVAFNGVLFVLLMCFLGGKILFKYIEQDVGLHALLTAGFILSMSVVFFVSFVLFHFVKGGLSYREIFNSTLIVLIILALLIYPKQNKEYLSYLLNEKNNEDVRGLIVFLIYSFVYTVLFYYGKANILSNQEFGVSVGDWANQTDLYAHYSRNIDPILIGLPLVKLKHMFNHFAGLNFAYWSFGSLTLATSIVSFKMLLPMFLFTILVWLEIFYKFAFQIRNAFVWALLTPLFAPITLNIVNYDRYNSKFGFLSWTSLYHSDTQLLVVAPVLIALYFLFKALKKNDTLSFTVFSLFLFFSFFVKPSGYTVIFPSVLLVLLIFRKHYSIGYVFGIVILLIPPLYWKLYSSLMGVITNADKIKLEFAFLKNKIKGLGKVFEYEELSFSLAVLIISLLSFLFVIPTFLHLIKRKYCTVTPVTLFVIVVAMLGIIPTVLFDSGNANIGWLAVISIMIVLPAIIRYSQIYFDRRWNSIFYLIMSLHLYSGFKFGWYFVKFG
jgi:hypothetical protein